jgi:hypothetical protein
MPSHFRVIQNGEIESQPFNRFHLSEVTGQPVKTKQEMPNDVVELTTEQAWELIDKWNLNMNPAVDPEYSL